MPPKKGCLSKEELNKRLTTAGATGAVPPDALAKASRRTLLEAAKVAGLVKAHEYDNTVETANICVKRYLRSLVSDPKWLDALDQYVIMASQVRALGSKLVNLFAIRGIQHNWFTEPDFLKKSLLNQTFIKYAFLPFKHELSRAVDPTGPIMGDESSVALQRLKAVWIDHRHLLEPLYPSHDDLRRVAWDQPLNDMAREYIGALTSHVLVHFSRRMAAALRAQVFETLRYTEFVGQDGRKYARLRNGEGNAQPFLLADMYHALESGTQPAHGLPHEVSSAVQELRQLCGAGEGDDVSDVKLTPRVLIAHAELAVRAERRNVHSWAVCPVVKTRRTFAYLDERVLEGLQQKFKLFVPAAQGTLSFLERVLGVHEEAWNAASKRARQQRRRSKKSRRGSRRRRQCGIAKFPDGWKLKSASTDGVAICAVLSRPKPPRPPQTDNNSEGGGNEAKPKRASAKVDRQSIELQRFLAVHGVGAVHLIAEDKGRCNISQTTQPGKSGIGFVQDRLTRHNYLRRTLQNWAQEQENLRRRQSKVLRIAIDHLSYESWRTPSMAHFRRMLERQHLINDILVDEYVTDNTAARRRMLLWRRRRSVLMQHYAALVRRAQPGTPVVLGVGDAKFAATGRGERSVPTSGATAEAHRALRSLRKRNPAMVEMVDERRTTMTHHACGAVLQNVRGDDGQTLRGLKLCRRCAAQAPAPANEPGPSRAPASASAPKCHRVVYAPTTTCPCGAGERRAVIDDKGRVLARLWLCASHTWDAEHAHRLVNRDVNAARNIWLALDASVRGLPRPAHLVIHRRSGQQEAGPLLGIEQGHA